MAQYKESFICKDCGQKRKDFSLERTPCVHCGGTRIIGHVLMGVNIGVETFPHKIIGKNKLKRKSKGGRFYIETTKKEIYRKTGEPQIVRRIFDYCKNTYSELIISLKTGKVIIDFKEKLTNHQNHGSARKKDI